MNTVYETVRHYAARFAYELNCIPREKENWRQLDKYDEIPDGDYEALIDECGEVTDIMEAVYRDTFNAIAFPDG